MDLLDRPRSDSWSSPVREPQHGAGRGLRQRERGPCVPGCGHADKAEHHGGCGQQDQRPPLHPHPIRDDIQFWPLCHVPRPHPDRLRHVARLLDVRREPRAHLAGVGRVRRYRGRSRADAGHYHVAHGPRVRPVDARARSGLRGHLGNGSQWDCCGELRCQCPWTMAQPRLLTARTACIHRRGLQRRGRRHLRRGVGRGGQAHPHLVLAPGPGARGPAGAGAGARALGQAVLLLQPRAGRVHGEPLREHAPGLRHHVLR
mmetsp:Transcript_71570/g.203049  ORF Transcript_71570/g.203049 Transcript_71570/m.203049 type:complete len:259 (-) Transcript_71570:394-1170(-)